MDMPRVQVLLACYNGEKYIAQQLDSILGQTGVSVELMIRDDGSTDGTRDILADYDARFDRIHVLYGENIGSNAGFFTMLSLADGEYVAFADQDDVWDADKLEIAVAALRAEEALLYCANKRLVDEELKPIPGGSFPKLTPGFRGAVVENICTGCTLLMTRELADLICRHLPEHAIYHDWWCYLTATYYGKVVFDETPHMDYRQHANNQVGAVNNPFALIAMKRKFLKKQRTQLGAQLREFASYHRGNTEKDALVDLILASQSSISARLRLAFLKPFYRQTHLDSLVVRLLFLMGKML